MRKEMMKVREADIDQDYICCNDQQRDLIVTFRDNREGGILIILDPFKVALNEKPTSFPACLLSLSFHHMAQPEIRAILPSSCRSKSSILHTAHPDRFQVKKRKFAFSPRPRLHQMCLLLDVSSRWSYCRWILG